MASVNKAILVGHLGKDPEIRKLSDGKRVANFSIATSETWKDKNTGERKEKSEWHRVSVFNDGIAGIVEKYLTKGSKVYVEGSLQTRKWTDKDGVEKYTTEIVIQAFNGNLVLLDKNTSEGSQMAQDGDNYSGQSYKPKFNHPGSPLNSEARADILNDDIPW